MSDNPASQPEDMPAVIPTAKERDPALKVQNFAGNEETVKKTLERCREFLAKFDAQGARDRYMDVMKWADQMFRLAASQTKQDGNKTRDDMDCRPDIFFRLIRAIVANESNILFQNGELPVKYEPMATQSEMNQWDGQRIADYQNRLMEYTFEVDGREQKIRDALWNLNKYGNRMFAIEWREEFSEVNERRPSVTNPVTNEPIRFDWYRAEQKRAFPALCEIDMDMVWFDANIDDVQKQQCILIRSFPVLSDLVEDQSRGRYMNVEKLTADHLYSQESPSQAKGERQENAGDDNNANVYTGEYDRWTIYVRLPIDKDGEWDDKATLPTWHRVTFCGNLELSTPVCLSLTKNPYGKKVPLLNVHTHADDKGAYHMGYPDILKPGYDEYKTTIDQWFDNKNLVNNSPWVYEKGAIITDDKTFGPRRAMVVRQGAIDKVKRLAVLSNTQDMQMFISYLEQRLKDAAGLSRIDLAEPMGSRTSAQEARTAAEQSSKPSLDKLRYMMIPFLKWMAEWDERMWRMFSPNDMKIAITGEADPVEIVPATLYGPMRYKVECIDEFENNAMARLEQDRFNQTILPVMLQTSPKESINEYLRWQFKMRRFPVEIMFPQSGEFDAVHVAQSENVGFLNGTWDEPKQGENHAVHIKIHGMLRDLYTLLPQQQEGVMRLIDAHILMHNQLKEQTGAQVDTNMMRSIGAGTPGAQVGMGGGEMGPSTPAEMGTQQMAAEGGDLMGGIA